MRFVRVAALAVLPSFALFTSSAFAADSCWHPNEAKAAQLRDLQIKLMVGTLQCRSKNSSAVELYNAFITKQRGLLDANAQILKTRFLRENGAKDGQAAYDRYATALANENSAHSGESNYCANMDTLVRMATSASQPDLLVLAQTMSVAPVSGPCSPSYYALAEGKVVEQPSVSAAAETAPQTAPETAEAAQPVATTTTEAAAPAPVKAEVAAPTAASQQDALQAAIVALQSATAALQAASASAAPTQNAAAVNQAVVVKVADAPIVPPKAVEE